MIEEITVHEEDAQLEAKREHQAKLAAWRRGQQEILAKVCGLAHKVGEEYDPATSEVLAYMVENLDPLFLAEQAFAGLRYTSHLKFDQDTRLWSGVSEAEREAKRQAKEVARAEEVRIKEERKALRAAGKPITTPRGRIAIYGPSDLAAWWILHHEEMGRPSSVIEMERFIERTGNALTRRAFFRLWAKTKTSGVLTASVDPANGRRLLIVPGPKWADAGLDLPTNWQTPDRASLPQPSEPEEPFI